MYLDLVYLNISFVAKVLRPYWPGHIAQHGRSCFSSNFKKGLFLILFASGVSLQLEHLSSFSLHNLYCKFYMRPKEDLFK